MTRTHIIIFSIFLITACNQKERVDYKTIENIQKYIDAKNLINRNRDFIKQSSNNQENLNRFWSQYYFENTILPNNPSLKPIKSLWEENYISDNTADGLIYLGDDGLVGFVTFYDESFFNSITHLLIFSEKDYQHRWPEEIIKKKMIDKNWTYLVLKKYTAD